METEKGAPKAPPIIVVVVGTVDSGLVIRIRQAIEECLDGVTVDDMIQPRPDDVTYRQFRSFYMKHLEGTDAQRQGWAIRGWWQLVSNVPKAKAFCVLCKLPYGQCRCTTNGGKADDGAWYYDESKRANWCVGRANLRELARSDLSGLHYGTIRHLMAFVEYLSTP